MPEEKTLNDLFRHIKEHESEIYVRLKIDGKWKSESLANLSPEDWANNVERFITSGIWPVYVKGGG